MSLSVSLSVVYLVMILTVIVGAGLLFYCIYAIMKLYLDFYSKPTKADIIFNVKKEWFDKIKDGIKTHEYRKANDYWTPRIKNAFSKQNPIICFKLGYPTNQETDKMLWAKAISYKRIKGIKTDLKTEEYVYDIKFQLI